MDVERSKQIQEWKNENQKRFVITLSRIKDEDVIRVLESKDSPTKYIRKLIRKDMGVE